ncbi:MAG: Fic family protein [Peptostreptococcales bacterium]
MMREIIKKKFILENRGPFSNKIIEHMKEVWLSEWVYSSNRLSGSSMSLKETLAIIKGEYILSRTIEDHMVVSRHVDVIHHLEKMAMYKEKMYSDKISYINNLFCEGEDYNYRDNNPVKLECKYIPPHFKEVPHRMKEFNHWYLNESKDLNPVLKSTLLHHKIMAICPYKEENEKTARALLNFELIKAGYPAISFDMDETYYNDLISLYMRTGQYEEFYDKILKCLNNRLEFFINLTSN